jgi:NADPH2:quinone reductase
MMAERAVVSRAFCLPVPDEIDDLTAAALPNAALASWLALAFRAQLQPGETALILGATGVSGKLAIQVAKHLGAGRVVAAGRNETILSTLTDLGADAVISLSKPDQALAETFTSEAARRPFDIILDFLWGHPASMVMRALTRHDILAEASRIRFVSIGEMAGSTVSLPSAALRSSGLEIYGSGDGSIAPQALFETFPRMWALAAQGKLSMDLEPVPLADVESAWQRQDTAGRRLVFLP